MHCSPVALCAVVCSLIFSPCGYSQTATVANGSTNHVLSFATWAGRLDLPADGAVTWPVDASTLNTVSVDGASVATFTAQPGHDYNVTCAASGAATVVDRSPSQTGWFWLGFATSTVAGIAGLGARWTRRVLSTNNG